MLTTLSLTILCHLLDRRGNRWLMIIATFNMVILYPGTRMYYIWRNKQRDKIWNAMTEEVCQVYRFFLLRSLFTQMLAFVGKSELSGHDEGCRESETGLQVRLLDGIAKMALVISQFDLHLSYSFTSLTANGVPSCSLPMGT